ncbi:MAG: RtsE [Candidatus Lindowbacteria bacterium RIFCSPLOWO2_12_FULL_62_27]|nr:MAG: RtsE [Candidatus Lindowbacteria bacterium RIFCSPLOWO2_12_FULL_62_27]OGH63815.1 MAG: RtsE [Candidatus Lindowbacteria bacterium RIFCSPLOWO2_02_FULL_62_12]
MFYSAKYQHNAKLNFSRLKDTVVGGRQLIRSICYIVQTPEIDQTNFMKTLDVLGYEVKSKDLKLRQDGSAKGDWDMGIAIDAMSIAPRVDVVALVTGDGDFAELVWHLRGQGVRVEVYSFTQSTAEELKRAATVFCPLTEHVLM